MTAPLLVVAGVGTGVGKTHVAAALARAWGRHLSVAAFKPVETGTSASAPGPDDDASKLEAASTFHVKHRTRGQRFVAPLAPNVAARLEGRTVDTAAVVAHVAELRSGADAVIVELAGGLFSPLSDDALQFDLVRTLAPTSTVLLALDRLGVIHEVLATVRAAAPLPSTPLLVAPSTADASTGLNGGELARLLGAPLLGPLPRLPVATLVHHEAFSKASAALARALGLPQV